MELMNDTGRWLLGSHSIRNPVTGEFVEGYEIPLPLLADVQRNLVLLLAPFAPYLAHELREMLGEKASLLKASWPKFDPELAKEEEIEIPVQVNTKLRSKIVVAPDPPSPEINQRSDPAAQILNSSSGLQTVH